jgi:hypothetical protein
LLLAAETSKSFLTLQTSLVQQAQLELLVDRAFKGHKALREFKVLPDQRA